MNENRNKLSNRIFELTTAFVLFFFIVSASIFITLHFRPLYYMDIDLLDIEAYSGMPREEIIANYDVLIDYNSIFGGMETLELPTLPMSETGRIHFEEVKVIFTFFQWAAIVSLILVVLLIRLNQKKENYYFWKYTSVISIAVPVILVVLIALNWDMVFVVFHKIMFNNDYWIFDASTDPVIMILPDSFFMHCAIMALLGVVVGSVGCFLVYLQKKRWEEKTYLY